MCTRYVSYSFCFSHSVFLLFRRVLYSCIKAHDFCAIQFNRLTSTLQSRTVLYTLKTMNIDGMSGATAAHIHIGAKGANGGVIAALMLDSMGKLRIANDEHWQALMSGNAYVNVHSAGNPGGEVRGQLSMASKPGWMTHAFRQRMVCFALFF